MPTFRRPVEPKEPNFGSGTFETTMQGCSMRHLLSGRRHNGHPTSSDHAAPRHPRRRLAIVTALLVFAARRLAGRRARELAAERIRRSWRRQRGDSRLDARQRAARAARVGDPPAQAARRRPAPRARVGVRRRRATGERAGLSASGSAGARGIGGRAQRASGAGNGTAATGAGSSGTAFAARAADRGTVESEDLGLTAQDLIYVLLVLAALAAVWALTARLARTSADGEFSGAKGTAQGTRLKP